MRRIAVFLAFAALWIIGAPGESHAYRTFSDEEFCDINACTDGRVVHTAMPVRFELNRAGSNDLPIADVETAVQGAFSAWTEPACTDLTIEYAGRTDLLAYYDDGHNVVTWVESGWSALGYGPATLGVTSQEMGNDGSGWVIDAADMQLNGDDWTWTVGPSDGSNIGVHDVVIHEAGHFFGVMHPCEPYMDDYAPYCPDIMGSTDPYPAMWPSNTYASRTLTNDDRDAICFLYPAATPGCTTECPSGTTCNASSGTCVPNSETDGGNTSSDATVHPMADANTATTDGGSPPSRRRSSGGCGCAVESRRVPTTPLGVSAIFLSIACARRRRAR
jgi:hypothetical protein